MCISVCVVCAHVHMCMLVNVIIIQILHTDIHTNTTNSYLFEPKIR